MKVNTVLLAATCAASLSLATAFAGGEGWSHDFDAAKKQAATEEKSLLMDFTGSDWCGWCIKLNKEVFSHDEFKTGVKDKFVLVEFDFPKNKSKLSPETIAQNEKAQTDYSISGFPTILLADAEGKPFARTGYQAGGPEKYVESLDKLLEVRAKRDAAFEAADKAEGVEKAKALVGALKEMGLADEIVASFYGDKIKAIKAADPKDESGYVKGLEEKQKFGKFQGEVNSLAQKGDFEGALKVTEDTLANAGFTGDSQQQVALFKGMILAELGKKDEALKALDEAKAIDPASEVAGHIDQLKERISKAPDKK